MIGWVRGLLSVCVCARERERDTELGINNWLNIKVSRRTEWFDWLGAHGGVCISTVRWVMLAVKNTRLRVSQVVLDAAKSNPQYLSLLVDNWKQVSPHQSSHALITIARHYLSTIIPSAW